MSNIQTKFASWEVVTLGDVCAFKGGSGFKESFQGRDSGDHPFIKVSDLNLPGNEKYVLHSNNWVSSAELKELKATLQPIGATVFAKVGAALKLNRRRLLVRPTVIDNNMMAAIPAEVHLDREYLYYFMLGEDLGRFSQESAVPSINQGHLESIEIPLPPLAEQRKIAEILRTWDEAIETAETELKAKQELLQGFLEDAFGQSSKNAGGEGKLLKEVVKLVKGKKPDLHNEYFAGAMPYLVAKFIRGEEKPKFVSPEDENAIIVVASDIVIICDGSNSGEMFTGLDGVLSSTMAKLILIRDDFSEAYVRYFVGYIGTRLSEAQEGGAIPHLDREKLLGFRVPMPALREQRKITERLSAAELAVQCVSQRTVLLRTQKRGLMQKLLTGEVRVAA